MKIALVCLLGAVGCAGAAPRGTAEVQRLRSQVALLRAEREDRARTISELRNRIFILEDRVDTQRVAMSRELPVVRLAPPGGTVQDAEPEPEPEEADAEPAGRRPVLKLYQRHRSLGGEPLAPLRPLPAKALGPQDALPVVTMEGLPQPGAAGISAGTAARAPAAGAAESSSADDASTEAIDAYESAFSLFRARRFDEALSAFQRFLERYRRHSYADNALYWRGECHYARRDFRAALAEFETVLSRYPDGNKAPDAMLKAALSRAELGDPSRARAMLLRLIEQFPRSDAARIAQERAARLGPPPAGQERR